MPNTNKLKPYRNILIALLLTAAAVYTCNSTNTILKGQSFDDGDWFLVHRNYLNDSILVIDDEEVLKANSKKLIVDWSEEDKGTTCDGVISLYKNGQLVNEQEYLSASHLYQSNDLERSYAISHQTFFQFDSSVTPMHICDSFLKTNTYYPVMNTNQNAGIVLFERPENKKAAD